MTAAEIIYRMIVINNNSYFSGYIMRWYVVSIRLRKRATAGFKFFYWSVNVATCDG
jgi:hypothetical protein